MSEPTLRPAVVGDAADIHTLLLRLADEIPLAVETLEQEEALYAQLRKTLGWGESWVAEAGGQIVGCIVVDNVQTGRHWGENEALDLCYAAGEGLDALLDKVLERKVPITASVRDANRSGLAELLERSGFNEAETRAGERRFRREP
ncbi:MAG: hypothetical protein WB697_17195 [Stellaceae bacterium]